MKTSSNVFDGYDIYPNVFDICDNHGRKPIHYAAAANETLFMWLMTNTNDPNSKDRYGMTPSDILRSWLHFRDEMSEYGKIYYASSSLRFHGNTKFKEIYTRSKEILHNIQTKRTVGLSWRN
jgi:hypothetical protein